MILLIRHGETEFNREGRCQGRVDSPLTALGESQARAAGERLAGLTTTPGGALRLETSPLGRARRTAEIIAEVARLPQPLVDPDLVEVSYGELEGLLEIEIAARADVNAVGGLFGRAPGGETLEALKDRVGAWLSAHLDGPPTAAVTHAGVVRAMRGVYLGLDDDEIWALDKPQDAIFRLADGRVDRLDCPPLPRVAPRG